MSKLTDAINKLGLTPSKPVPPRPPAQRRTIPDYNPFPVDALPDVLREFAIEVAESIGCDVSFAALPALTLAGAAIGNALHISPNKRGHTEPPLLWACTVGDPGTGKSPALKPIDDIAVAIQAKHRLEFAQDCAAYAQLMTEWEEAGKDPDKKPSKPMPKLFRISDITVEQLIADAAENTRGMVLVRDELAGWLNSLSRYSNNGGSDSPTWLTLYDGKAISYRRRTGEPRFVEAERSFVSIFGGIQPETLRGLFANGQHVGNGMASRIIFAYPPKRCPDSESELSFETEQNFKDVICWLQELPFTKDPHIVKLMPDAYAAYRLFAREFSKIAEGIEGGPEAAIYPKAKMLALRLALIDHAVTEAASQRDPYGSVPLACMTRAIALARWFTAEALRVYAMLAESPEETAHRHIVELVKRNGGIITVRELQRSNIRKYPRAENAELALEVLVNAGLGQWTEERPERGGTTVKRFVLNTQQPMPEDCDEGDEDPTDLTTTAEETAPAVDPWNDVAQMHSALKAAGKTWADALEWLKLLKGTVFFQVPEDQRRRAYLHFTGRGTV